MSELNGTMTDSETNVYWGRWILAAWPAGTDRPGPDLAAMLEQEGYQGGGDGGTARLPWANRDDLLEHLIDPNRRHNALEQLALLADIDRRRIEVVSRHNPDPAPVSWLVDGWMPDATLSVLTGDGGAGKSRIALQLAVAVATGGREFIRASDNRRPPALHAPTVNDTGPVVFAAWETRQLAFANRLASACGAGADRAACMEALNARLHYVNMRPAGGLWGSGAGEHTSTAGGLLPGGRQLLRFAESAGARLLIVDPVAAAFVQNENDRALVRAFLSAMDQWADANGCAVLLIQHPPKSDYAQSGSTDWRNGVQAVWELKAADQNDPTGPRKLRIDKLNEGRMPPALVVDYEGGRFVEVNEQRERMNFDDAV